MLAYSCPFYFADEAIKLAYYDRVELGGELNLQDRLEDLYINAVVLVFAVLALQQLGDYTQRVLQAFSNLQQAKVHWLKFLTRSVFILSAFALILSIVALGGVGIPMSLNFVTAVCTTFIIYYTSYYAIFNGTVFPGILFELKPVPLNRKSPVEVSELSR